MIIVTCSSVKLRSLNRSATDLQPCAMEKASTPNSVTVNRIGAVSRLTNLSISLRLILIPQSRKGCWLSSLPAVPCLLFCFHFITVNILFRATPIPVVSASPSQPTQRPHYKPQMPLESARGRTFIGTISLVTCSSLQHTPWHRLPPALLSILSPDSLSSPMGPRIPRSVGYIVTVNPPTPLYNSLYERMV